MDFCSGMLAETHLKYDSFCLLPSVLLFELVVSRPQKRKHFTFEVISGNAHEVKNDMPRRNTPPSLLTHIHCSL